MITIQPAPTTEKMSIDTQNWVRWFTFLVGAFNVLTATGTTAQRPNPAPFIGFMYYDTTLSIPIWAKTATQYVDATGANV